MNRPLRAILIGVLAVSLPVACTAQAPDAAATSRPIAPAPSATPSAPIVTGLPDFTTLVERVGPAVVNIRAEIAAPRRSARAQMPEEAEIPEIFRRFFGPGMPFPGAPQGPQGPQEPRGGVSQGTGFLISADGYVLTNHHVVDGAETVQVSLSDRREFTAEVIGSDQPSDVALLKIDASNLPSLRLANADNTKAGQWVIAIGSPFGLEQSVTAGIVSAVGRSNPYANQQYVPFIQTDVAINRGNSGGPLLNTSGEVVGINSQIFSNSGGYMGVSFAIPIDVAMNAAEQLRNTGQVSRGQLGVQVQQVTSEHMRGLGLPDTNGALVSLVLPGSAAAAAGIQRMDVIRAIDGKPVNLSSDLPPLIGAKAPGTRAAVRVFREGRNVDVNVVLAELDMAVVAGTRPARPNAPGRPAAPAAEANILGLVVQDIPAEQRQRLGLPSNEGVLVAGVNGKAVREADLQTGDVILSVGRTSVASAAELNRALARAELGKTMMLLVRRGGSTQYIAVTPQAEAG
ncbi:MAG: DegQ family serine endoprotease [Pseudomonadota bacterium]|nr:DegQ family serine endoprotease [Pseudomonadota bacterium]